MMQDERHGKTSGSYETVGDGYKCVVRKTATCKSIRPRVYSLSPASISGTTLDTAGISEPVSWTWWQLGVSILATIKAFFSGLGALFKWLGDKQLMDAGEAKGAAKRASENSKATERVNDAREKAASNKSNLADRLRKRSIPTG
jgi:hypothetical protein